MAACWALGLVASNCCVRDQLVVVIGERRGEAEVEPDAVLPDRATDFEAEVIP